MVCSFLLMAILRHCLAQCQAVFGGNWIELPYLSARRNLKKEKNMFPNVDDCLMQVILNAVELLNEANFASSDSESFLHIPHGDGKRQQIAIKRR